MATSSVGCVTVLRNGQETIAPVRELLVLLQYVESVAAAVEESEWKL